MTLLIHILTSDKQKIQLNAKLIPFSQLLISILEDSSYDEEIPLNVTKNTLLLIDRYFEHDNYNRSKFQVQIPFPLATSDLSQYVEKFDFQFISSLNMEELSNLLEATQYLEIETLYELTCAYISTFFKDKSIKEIQKKFEISQELTPQLEDQLYLHFKPDIFYYFQ